MLSGYFVAKFSLTLVDSDNFSPYVDTLATSIKLHEFHYRKDVYLLEVLNIYLEKVLC